MAATDDTPRTRITWDYAPAPESPDHVRLRDSYGLFIGGEFVDPRDGRRVPSINPATEEPVAEVAFAGEADVAAAVEAARAAQPKWAKLPGRERAKYLFRVARLIQERARELAVVESHGRRQADPRVARRRRPAGRRALLLLRRLGRQAPVRRRRAQGQALRRRRPDRAVELPAADGGLEARAGAGVRQHGDPQAGRDDAADRAAAGRDLPGGRAAGRRGEHRHRRRRRRRRARALRGRQGRLHRLDRGRQGHPGRARRPRRRAHARARRQVGQHRLRGRRHRPGGRGHRPGDLLQPGPRLLRRLAAAASRSRWPTRSPRSCGTACACCASATRSTRTPTSARSTRPSSSQRIEALVAAGRGGGRGAAHDRLRRCPSAATGSRRRSSPTSRPRTASRSRRSSARWCRC